MRTVPHKQAKEPASPAKCWQVGLLPILPPLFVAAALRLYALTTRDLWHDEGLQYGISAAGGLYEILRASATLDLHPPLYSLFVAPLTYLAPWALRLPSMVSGVVCVWLAACIGEQLGGAKVGIRMAWFTALAPAWVAYGHEGRPYAVGLMLLMGLYLELVARRPEESRVALWGVLCGVWQYGTAVVAVAALFGAASEGRFRRAWLATLGASVLSLAFLLLTQWSRGRLIVNDLPGTQGLEAPLGLVATAGWLVTGTPGWPALLLGGLVCMAAVVWRQPPPCPSVGRAVLFPLGAGVILALAAVYPMGSIRQALPWTVPIVVAMAGVFRRLPSSVGRWGLVCLLAVTLARAPGVPVEEQRRVLLSLEDRDGPLWVHPSAAPAYDVYGAETPDRRLDWSDRNATVPYPLWLLASGRACSQGRPVGGVYEVVERIDRRGACALRLAPRSP